MKIALSYPCGVPFVDITDYVYHYVLNITMHVTQLSVNFAVAAGERTFFGVLGIQLGKEVREGRLRGE